MDMVKVDVIIPTYRPGRDFARLLKRLAGQTCPPEKMIIMNTEEDFWDKSWEKEFPMLEVHHLKKEEFDHGGTRRLAASFSQADIMVYMTQDAVPADKKLIENLVKPIISGEKAGAAYARQLPKPDCSYLERYTRSFNYPRESCVKWEKDIPVYGIKTFFCSNVCAAYDRRIFWQTGGFPDQAIFNEDMIYAAKMQKAGYGVAYAADARVYHSHNYSGLEQLHRNFDLGVSQAEHPEIFGQIPSEGEGLRLVKKSLSYLVKTGHIHLIPSLVFQSGCKYIGYFLGKRYQRLPDKMVQFLTMNREYWKEKNV